MMEDYEIVSMLGPCFGLIGVVLLARKQSNLKAVKKLDLDVADTNSLLAIQKELLLLRQLKHPNIIHIDSCFIDTHCLYITIPLAGYGSCADLIANHFPNGLNEGALALILKDVLAGLTYLHSRRLVHRAIRGRHILVTATGRSQLCSLRHAEPLPYGKPSHAFTDGDADNVNWLSPEMLAQDAEGYEDKSDIYSIGMTCLELTNGCPPYNEVCPTFMLVEKLRGCLPTFNGQVSAALSNVASVCTFNDPQHRPSAQQLLTMPFFKVKGDLRNLLHPVIPLGEHQMQADRDDVNAILAGSHRMADISIDNSDWSFD